MLPLLRSVLDLALHVFVESQLSSSLLIVQLPKQARALPDLLDAHLLRSLPQGAVHGLPILLIRSIIQRLPQRAGV